MVAYSFQPRFVDPIRCGLGIDQFLVATGEVVPKRQTIRAVGLRRHARPCEELQLYTGLRSKRARLIGRARCTSVAGICIFLGRGVVSIDDYPAIRDGDLDAFAQQDGFSDWLEMRGFWAQHHPGVDEFKGLIIKWEPLGGLTMFTAKEKLACAERELKMRARVYPRWVGAGKMLAETARRETDLMQAIVEDYRKLAAAEEPQGGLPL